MILFKTKTRFTALLLMLVFSNTTLAAETVTNDHKNNRTSDTIGHVDLDGDTNGDSAPAVNKGREIKTCAEDRYISNGVAYQQMQARRHQVQQEQLEAYKQFLQNRNRQPSANISLQDDVRARREEYISNMEKMREENRKAADERWQKIQLKMHQTNTAPAMADEA